MPARELERLLERLHPGVPVRALERGAGLPHDRIQHWLKPGTAVSRLPPPDAIREIARALGCSVGEVLHAFNDSLPEPLPLRDLAPEEAELLDRFRFLDRHDRASLLLVAQSMQGSATTSPPAERRRRGRWGREAAS